MKISLKQLLIIITTSVLTSGYMLGCAPAEQAENSAGQQERLFSQEIPISIQAQQEDESEQKESTPSVFNQAGMVILRGIQQRMSQAKKITLASVGSSIAAVRYVAKSGASAFISGPHKPDTAIQEIEVDVDQLKAERDELLSQAGVYGYLYFKLISFLGYPDDESDFEHEIHQDVLKSASVYIDSIVKDLKRKWFNIAENGIYVEQEIKQDDESEIVLEYICSCEQYDKIAENIKQDYIRIQLKLDELSQMY